VLRGAIFSAPRSEKVWEPLALPNGFFCLHKRIVKQKSTPILYQCCPTLSTFATCDDRRFNCGDRHVFRNESPAKDALRTSKILTNVATERIWLDTTVLYCPFSLDKLKSLRRLFFQKINFTIKQNLFFIFTQDIFHTRNYHDMINVHVLKYY
jgi:hypothetical protein